MKIRIKIMLKKKKVGKKIEELEKLYSIKEKAKTKKIG